MKPTLNTTQLPVACFAPPLSDAKLARYRELISAMPATPQKDAARACLACVEKWWELPESTRADVARWAIRHGGRDVTYVAQPLDDELVQALWAVTPWSYELDAMLPPDAADPDQTLLGSIQAGEARRNGQKLEAWRLAVRETLIARDFTAAEIAWLHSPARRMLRTLMDALARFGDDADPYIDPLVAAFAGPLTRADLADQATRMRAVEAETAAISNGEAESPLPRPALESTELRDAILTLHWYAKEITRDREPLTQARLAE
jgi:hypothetical protein